jgi:hypothetical protein
MKSLLLDRSQWDLVLDASNNIAVCAQPYAISQDVANACRLFIGELWLDTTQGISYFKKILGHRPPMSYLRAKLEEAALTVPGVVKARAVITKFDQRTVTGQIQFIDANGVSRNVSF